MPSSLKRAHDATAAAFEPPAKVAAHPQQATSPSNAENRSHATNVAAVAAHSARQHADDDPMDKTATTSPPHDHHHPGRPLHAKNWHREESLQLVQLVDALRPSDSHEWEHLTTIYNCGKSADDCRTASAVHYKWQHLAHDACLYPEGATHMLIEDFELVRSIVYDVHRTRELRHAELLAELAKEAPQIQATGATITHGPMYARIPAATTQLQGMERLAACLRAVKECMQAGGSASQVATASTPAGFTFDALSMAQLAQLATVLEEWCAHPEKHPTHAATSVAAAAAPTSSTSPASITSSSAASTSPSLDVAATFLKSAQHHEHQHRAVLAALARSLVVEQQRMTNEMWCAHRLAQAHHTRMEAIARERLELERERLALERERLNSERANFVALHQQVSRLEERSL